MSEYAERAALEGTPLMDGDQVTFVWLGGDPPTLCADFNSWGMGETATLVEAEPGVWIRTVPDLPRDAYIEYIYMRGWDRVLDPFNTSVSSNGVGGYNNFFYMPEAKPEPLARRRRGVPKGTVTREIVENDMAVVGGRREVYLYQPPTSDPVPLVVVWDGRDYLRRVRLPVMVDNLIAQGRMRPVALAMVQHGNQARFMEYCCSDATLGYLGHSVIPTARERLNLLDPAEHPGSYGVMGASMGGLMALYAGLRAPDIFGHVVAQSPSLILQALGHELVVWDLVRRGETPALKVWMDCGRYEPLLESNGRMADLMREKGYDLTYRVQSAGHNYPAWRNIVWRGLEAVFGPGAMTE